jgi:hypothetical protein
MRPAKIGYLLVELAQLLHHRRVESGLHLCDLVAHTVLRS